jgi:hypothetical protein
LEEPEIPIAQSASIGIDNARHAGRGGSGVDILKFHDSRRDLVANRAIFLSHAILIRFVIVAPPRAGISRPLQLNIEQNT